MSAPRRIVVTTRTVLDVDGDAPAREVGHVYFHRKHDRLPLRLRGGTTINVTGSTLSDIEETTPGGKRNV